MLDKMAEGEYFNPGMIVSCTTCHGHKVQGEVMAFDYKSKMLAIKSSGSSGRRNENDVKILNLNYASDVTVIKEMLEPPPPIPQLNISKITSRVQENVKEKQRRVNYINDSVTPQAQQLFLAITKTISDVEWDDKDIVVMKEVKITPPYRPEDCRIIKRDSTALNYITNIIEKHIRESESDRRSSSPTS